MPTMLPLREGTIYECTLSYSTGRLSLAHVTLRTDKKVPNRHDVALSVIDRARGTLSDAAMIMSQLSSATFQVRDYLYELAGNIVKFRAAFEPICLSCV